MYNHYILKKHAITSPTLPAKPNTRIIAHIGKITSLELMALRILALTSARGVVSYAHTAPRIHLLPTLARGSRHFANRPRVLQQQGDDSSCNRQTYAPFTNYEHIIIPDHHVQWLVKLKNGLDRKECERIAGDIEDHINRRKVSNANILIPRFTRLTSKFQPLSVDASLEGRPLEPELKVVMCYQQRQPGTKSKCHLAFNYPEHVDPHVKEEFESLEEFDLIGLSPPLRDAGSER